MGSQLKRKLICDYIHYNMWYEIKYSFQKLNSTTVEVWEWISNSMTHFTGYVITYPVWD